MTIAKNILRQLGNNKFIAMTGANTLIDHGRGLSFKLPAKKHFVKNGINYVKITLNSMDLYDIEYGKTTKKKFGFDYKTIEIAQNIYADQMPSHFEETTGLFTKL